MKMRFKILFTMLLLGLFGLTCKKKEEPQLAPTLGHIDMVADEVLKDVISEEEDLFERNYKYASLDIKYMPESEMMRLFTQDSVDYIAISRALTTDELKFFDERKSHPRQYHFGISALAFVVGRQSADTSITYEKLIADMQSQQSNKTFVIEDSKSGIAQLILDKTGLDKLPSHFYAQTNKEAIFDFVNKNSNAIGIIDWSDVSDSDDPKAQNKLNAIRLCGVTMPKDSVQVGYSLPYQYNLTKWKYPFVRNLYLISKTGLNDVGMGFASFVCGEIGQKVVLKAGLVPMYQTERWIELFSTDDVKVVKD